MTNSVQTSSDNAPRGGSNAANGLMRISALWLVACLVAGCSAQTDLRGQIRTLRYGSFEESEQAGKVVLADPHLSSGGAKQDIISILGKPDFETENGLDVCYRTGAGPLWLAFQRGQLIKKAIVTPPRWRGTRAELVKLWEEKRKTKTWYEW